MASSQGLHLHNTLTGKKEPFRPVSGNQVRMYVCGPTVYDVCHMGHARSYTIFDVLARYLRRLGFNVQVVINFTDVEERITERAEDLGVDPLKFADERIGEFFRVMDALGILRADRYPRVSEYVPQMIKVVQRLLDEGMAYHLGDKIFFDVKKAGGYGSLLHSAPEEAVIPDEPADGIGAQRRSPFDFEIWDGTVDKDPIWESPWGKGRIGWHVECYVMSKLLGHPLDIKGGGMDLIFPHHESTKLISSALGEELSRFYLHNGFLTFMDRKMSKSRGVYVSVAEALDVHPPEALRLFVLSKHYRETLAFSHEDVGEAERSVSRIRSAVERLRCAPEVKGEDDAQLLLLVEELKGRFESSMDDDLDTPSALRAVMSFIEKSEALRVGSDVAQQTLEVLHEIGRVLGFEWMHLE